MKVDVAATLSGFIFSSSINGESTIPPPIPRRADNKPARKETEPIMAILERVQMNSYFPKT